MRSPKRIKVEDEIGDEREEEAISSEYETFETNEGIGGERDGSVTDLVRLVSKYRLRGRVLLPPPSSHPNSYYLLQSNPPTDKSNFPLSQRIPLIPRKPTKTAASHPPFPPLSSEAKPAVARQVSKRKRSIDGRGIDD